MIIGISIWVLLVVLQAVFLSQPGAGPAACFVIAGGVMTCAIFARRQVLREYPISSSMILGYSLAYFFMPPLATMVEGKSLVNNLENTGMVFFHGFLVFLTLAGAHFLYQNIPPLLRFRFFLSEKVYQPASFFQTPTDSQLLVMGGIGLLAVLVNVSGGSGEGSVLSKVLNVVGAFAFVPYCMLVRSSIGDMRVLDSATFRTVAWYSCLMFVVAAALNSRSAFILGFASVALLASFTHLSGIQDMGIFKLRNVLISIVLVFLVSGPISNFATSMVIAREIRSDSSVSELLEKTLEVYNNPEVIRIHKLSERELSIGDWDETYIDNLFLSRLCNLRYADLSLGLAESLTDSGVAYVRESELQRAFSMIPGPILEFFGSSVDKTRANSGSGGDHLYFAATGSPFAIGGFRTGSLLGSALAVFGIYYPLPLTMLAILIFILADAQTARVVDVYQPKHWRPVLSVFAAASFFSLTFFFTSAATGAESLSALSGPIVRGLPQSLVMYWCVYKLSAFLSRFLEAKPA